MAAPDLFARPDPSADGAFYAFPRRVVHIEAGAIGALRRLYARELPAGEPVLDLMSSWRSHLPEDGLGPVSGLGMNAAEMADNPQLTAGFVVHDLNADPVLPYGDDAFGAAVSAVSVQYLTRPLEVFAELRRVLRPGGPTIVSFSNRCFPTKAIRAWTLGTDTDHVALVRAYLEGTGFGEVRDEAPPTGDDPLSVVLGRA